MRDIAKNRSTKGRLKLSHRIKNGLLISASALALSACADVPPQFRVDTGAEPRYEDKTVRFRTTYYFRVFDLCEGLNADGTEVDLTPAEFVDPNNPLFARNDRAKALRLEKDSLYRFTMTGKALAITNKVHFESGTLKSWQIDPFGASVEYDEDSGRFFFQSQEATERAARRNKQRNDQYQEIRRLLELKKDADLAAVAADQIDALIESAVSDLSATAPSASDSASGGAAASLNVDALKEAERLATQALRLAVDNTAKDTPRQEQIDNIESASDALKTSLANAAAAAKNKASDAILAVAQRVTAATAERGEVATRVETLTAEIAALDSQLKKLSESQTKLDERLTELNKPTDGGIAKAKAKIDTLTEEVAQLEEDTKELNEEITALQNVPDGTDPDLTKLGELQQQLGQKTQQLADKRGERIAAQNTFLVLNQEQTDLSGQKTQLVATITDITSQKDKAGDNLEKAEEAQKTVDEKLKKIEALKKQVDEDADKAIASAAKVGVEAAKASGDAQTKEELCGPGSEGQRGFQVMGPEGVRTFDQDERLLMAMSSSASPLIGVLKEVSSRVLDRRVMRSEPLLPYAQERVDVLEAQRQLDSLQEKPKKAAELTADLGKVIEAFARPEDEETGQ